MAVTVLDSKYATPTRVKFASPSNSTLHHAPSSATAAVATLSASDVDAGECWVLASVTYSYDAGGTVAGSLTIACGSDTWKVDIASAGVAEITFDPPFKFAADTAVTITLASGGSGVSGKINARNSWVEPAQ
jgi:hypothetical protein